MSATPAAVDGAPQGRAARARALKWFYAAMAAVLLALVLVGFSRTLYLRALFDVRPIGFWVFVHGSVLTAWFAGLVLQVALVNARRLDLHRRVGWALAALAAAAAATSLSITLGTIPAMLGAGLDTNAVMALGPRIVWGNYAGIVTFAVLVGAAVAVRRRAQAHKRLMLLASIAIISPALARILQWPLFGPDVNANFFVGAFLGSFVLVGAVAAFDLATRRRLHAATLVGGALLIGAKLAAVGAIAPSDFGRALVPGLM
jgi:hypothetical protein